MLPTLGSKDEENQVLTRLGLTFTQAKAYLALCRTGISPPKTISKDSGIARPDIYRILDELQKVGLVEKALTTPAMFKAIPLQDALLMLLERRVKATSELQAETRRILQNFRKDNGRIALTFGEAQFVLIPQGRAYFLRGKMAITASQKSIECVTSWKRFLQMMYKCGGDIMQALNRGVEFRVIVNKPEDQKPLPKIVEDVFRSPSCKARYVLALPRVFMVCFDKKEMLIATSAEGAFAESPMLWSNAPPLVLMSQDYFEILWIAAMER